MRRCPRPPTSRVEAFRVAALEGVKDPVKVDLSEEPTAEGDSADKTYKLTVTAGSDTEEHEGLTLKKGRANLATKVNSASKLIKIEETGASLPEAQRVPAAGSYTLSVPAEKTSDLKPAHFEGDVATRKGMGGLAAVDEITMVCMPDVMTLAGNGNGDAAAGPAGQDDHPLRADGRPDGDPRRPARPDCPGDPRLADEHRRLRLEDAALYYPWIKVMDPIGRKRPIEVPPVAGTSPACGRAPTDPRRAQGAGQRDHPRAPTGSASSSPRPSRACSTRSASTASGRSAAAASGSGARARCPAIRSGATSTSAGCSTIVGVDHARAPSGRSSSPTTSACGRRCSIDARDFLTRVWRDGALFGATPEEAFYVKCDAETNPPEVIEPGRSIVEVGIAPVKPAEFVVFRLSQFTGGAGAEVAEG